MCVSGFASSLVPNDGVGDWDLQASGEGRGVIGVGVVGVVVGVVGVVGGGFVRGVLGVGVVLATFFGLSTTSAASFLLCGLSLDDVAAEIIPMLR